MSILAIFMEKLFDLFLERIRREPFSLLLALGVMAGLAWWNIKFQRETRAEILDLRCQVWDCNCAKDSLAIRLAIIETRFAFQSAPTAPSALRRKH